MLWELRFRILMCLNVLILWRLFYIYRFKFKIPGKYFDQSVSQQHVDSFMPAVLLTVTARSLPAILKCKTRNCCRSCGRRAPARLVWATGTPSLLRTPANCPHSKHNVAGFECRHDWFRVVTNAIDLN